MSRTIEAPGVELREIDKSQYDSTSNEDNSIVNTSTFIMGFANEGEDYTTQWINSKQKFINQFGEPQNEPEKYFYNAAIEILNKGGICLASKLPYNNESKDNYTYVKYLIENDITTTDDLTCLDSTLTNYFSINGEPKTNLMSLENLDKLKTGDKTSVNDNSITIVNISKKQYDTIDINCVKDNTEQNYSNDCLGIIPIITTAANALYFQNCQISEIKQLDISLYNNILDFSTVSNNSKILDFNEFKNNLLTPLSSSYTSDNIEPTESWSKISTKQFPLIQYVSENKLDTTYLKSIGILVVQAYATSSNKTNVDFKILESFVGSLDPNEKDATTHKSIYIDTIVNQNSKYINVFSKVKTDLLKKSSFVSINNSKIISLGFYKSQLSKKINYQNSLMIPISKIFETNKNTVSPQIDLIVDAGITNLGMLAYNSGNNEIDFTDYPNIADHSFPKIESDKIIPWKTLIQKFDIFCKNTRKDCMFIADGLRQLVLNGNQKIVSPTKCSSSVETNIIPYLKYMQVVNSSYSAGYCNWFQIQDEYSGDYFWIPPSIKAAGIYINTDAYFHKWDAPAGIIRGRLNNVIDCSFSANIDEAGKIYSQAWNYANNYPLEGAILEGQKTFQLKKTAFDRINVRRLFLYLEKSVSRIGQYFKYMGNTEYLRQRLVDTIKPIFDDAVNGQGILEYYIKCDDENNTAQTIDNNEIHCQIIVKPVKSIEYIVLEFTCTNQSTNISETIINS